MLAPEITTQVLTWRRNQNKKLSYQNVSNLGFKNKELIFTSMDFILETYSYKLKFIFTNIEFILAKLTFQVFPSISSIYKK